jgi:hypothetical protein
MTQDYREGGKDDPSSIAWGEVAGNRGLVTMHTCEFEMAEEVIALMVFEDGTCEIGIGESLRPYQSVFEGDFDHYAFTTFWSAIQSRMYFGRKEVKGQIGTGKKWAGQSDDDTGDYV